MADYYDRDGNPMKLMDWAVKFEDLDYKRVAFTKVGDLEVSTVWLGLDHGRLADQRLIFETIVFGAPEERMQRYATLEDAERGHVELVEELQRV